MCKKRQYLLELLDGTVQTTVSRGCANQKNDEMVRLQLSKRSLNPSIF